MSYNNNGNNNDNRKGKGKGKKNKRKRNQLTPIKNAFKKSQSEYSPNSPPKHGTKARCISKQGKKVKEFIKKGKQAQSFIFGDYAFAGYSDDNINGDNDNIDGDNDNTNERLDLNSKWGDRSDARSMKLLLDIQNEVDVKADTTTEEEEEEEDFDMIGAGVFNHRGVERRSGRGGGITVQSRGRARGRNNSESKPTLKSKSKSKSNLRSKSRSKSRAPRSKSRSRISGISVERKRSKSKARSRSRSRSRLVSGAQANQAVLDELDDQQAPINVRQVLPGNFDNPDPRLEEELLPLSDESDSANDGDGDNINDAGSQSQSQSQSQSNSRNLFERAEPVGYTEENKDTFDWDTAEAEGYERDEEKMKELRTWLRQNKGWTGSCCATRWLSQYVWLYFKYDHDNPRMLCIICFRYLGKEGLLFLVTSDRQRFQHRTGVRIIPAFGASKAVSAGTRNNTLESHQRSRLHQLAKDDVSQTDILIVLKSYLGAITHCPATTHPKMLYCDWLTQQDIGKIQHTPQARNKFILISAMIVQR